MYFAIFLYKKHKKRCLLGTVSSMLSIRMLYGYLTSSEEI